MWVLCLDWIHALLPCQISGFRTKITLLRVIALIEAHECQRAARNGRGDLSQPLRDRAVHDRNGFCSLFVLDLDPAVPESTMTTKRLAQGGFIVSEAKFGACV
jgi:hypothetical protein